MGCNPDITKCFFLPRSKISHSLSSGLRRRILNGLYMNLRSQLCACFTGLLLKSSPYWSLQSSYVALKYIPYPSKIPIWYMDHKTFQGHLVLRALRCEPWSKPWLMSTGRSSPTRAYARDSSSQDGAEGNLRWNLRHRYLALDM